jgi:hypothetical protein
MALPLDFSTELALPNTEAIINEITLSGWLNSHWFVQFVE